MDKTLFAGTSFTNIFYQGMRLVFMDEKGNPGMLYRGEVFEASIPIVAANKKRLGFTEMDQERLLLHGVFKYEKIILDDSRLRFEGPDKDDLKKSQYAEGQVNGCQVDVHFYNIIKDAQAGTGAFLKQDAAGNWVPNPVPQNAAGVTQLAYFTAAIVLHEIMHNHGFTHPYPVDWTPGSYYASTLPQVALQSVLNAAQAQLGSQSSPLAISDGSFPPPPSTGTGWHGWEALGGQITSSVATASWGPDRLDIFVRGTDGQLWHKWYDQGWQDWEALGGQITDGPGAVATGSNHLHICARGTDGQLWHKWWDDQGWHDWEALGGQITSSVATASWGPDRLDIFVRGTDGQLWHKWYDQGWQDWEALGGQITDGPGAVATGPNHLHICARGTDGQLWHKWWDDQGWHDWEALGGQITSSVATASWGPDRLDIFVRGTDGQLWHKWYDQGWQDWEALGGQITDGPGAVATGPNHLHICARGTDSQLWHKWWG